MTIIFATVIFLDMIQYIVIIDIVLSWLTLFGIRFRPKCIADIIDPMYRTVRNTLPTSLGPLDFTPIIIIGILMLLRGGIFILFPEIQI